MSRRSTRIMAPTLALLFLAGCGEGSSAPAPTRFRVTITNVAQPFPFVDSGDFTVAEGAAAAGPALPGQSFAFTVHAAPGMRLSFATMFAQSNDFFFAPGPEGIALFDEEGEPRHGDVTDEVALWDSGTELNQEPGLGADQAPRQAGPDTGSADPDPTVRLAPDDYGNLPAVDEVIRVTLEPTAANVFLVRLENVSQAMTLTTSTGEHPPIPLSPGVWVVHTSAGPLFTPGEPDRGAGLEAIAEDGNPSALGATLGPRTGVASPLSPGFYLVHTGAAPLFAAGQLDDGHGLEAQAEDGDPSELLASFGGADALRGGVFDTPDGAAKAGPALPGESYSFELEALPGDRLSFTTMLGQSNDYFFAPAPEGLALFDGAGVPVTGDVTSGVDLWNAGTEADQHLGTGPDQAPRQPAPDTGAAEGAPVAPVAAALRYASVNEMLRVTLTVVPTP